MTPSADLATVAEDLALAAVALTWATGAMDPLSMGLYELQDEQARRQEDEARPGPPYEMAAKKIGRVFGLRLDGKAFTSGIDGDARRTGGRSGAGLLPSSGGAGGCHRWCGLGRRGVDVAADR